MSDPNDTGDTGFDLSASMDAIASEIIGKKEPVTDDTSTTTTEAEGTTQTAASTEAAKAAAAATTTTTTTAPTPRAPPKSWSHDKHELWSKLPPDAQEYYEKREKDFLDGTEQYKGDATYGRQFKDVVAPYVPHLRAQGINESEAVGYLLDAHFKLTQGTPDQKASMYRQLGVDLGLVQGEEGGDQTLATNPLIQRLQKQVTELVSRTEADQQAARQAARSKADAETSAFAADPANVHFKEVATDMVGFVKQGLGLKDAYEKAVWANPVTRAKEQAVQAEKLQTELREKAKTEAEAARRATSMNVRDANTRTAPTEPKGTMEDTMRETLKKIRNRA